MPNYRRLYSPSSTYFFTLVTFNRINLFSDSNARICLRNQIEEVKQNWPFEIVGFVLLPNHLHTIWTLPEGDSNFSVRWKLIKSNFTRNFLKIANITKIPNRSRIEKKEQTVWQRRYWEHLIRDEKDFQNHLDYIHYNPVKHGYVNRPLDWEWSTFQRYVNEEWYDPRWGESEPNGLIDACVGE